MKIAICTPLHGDPRSQFATSLAQLLCYSYENWPHADDPPEIRFLTATGSNLPGNREDLFNRADEWGADWILWADSDQTFPPDGLIRLLSIGKPIVGCSSPRRHRDALPSAQVYQDNKQVPVWTTPDKVKRNVVEPVHILGFSLFLMSVEALRPLKPLFVSSTGYGATNEDAFLCHRLREAGHQILVDHGLSWHVGHVHYQILTAATSIEQKNRREMAAQAASRRAK